MVLLRILDYPDPRLKTIAPAVTDIHDPRIQQMVDDMLETLEKTPHCGGLAATQLDIIDPVRIFVFYDDDHGQNNAICVINPEIVETVGEQFEEEGCMSVYSDYIRIRVKRPVATKLSAIDRHGKPFTLERDSYLATLFIHETDHLNGKLCIDHLKPIKRKMIDKKIDKIRKKWRTK